MPEIIRFSNQNITLSGELRLPLGLGPFPLLVVLHPASNPLRGHPFYRHLAHGIPAHDMAVFVFDRRGSGDSGGNFDTSSFEDLAGDALAAARCLAAHPQIDLHAIGLYGISQGGWLAPLAAAQDSLIQFLVIVSGCGVSPAEQMNYAARWTLENAAFPQPAIDTALGLRRAVDDYYRGLLTHAETTNRLKRYAHDSWYPQAYLPDPERLPLDVRSSKWFYQFSYDPLPVWQRVTQPSLFLFAESDRWVPVDESLRRYQQATSHIPNVRFEVIQGTNHMMEDLTQGTEDGSGVISTVYQQTLTDWLTEVVN